MGQFFATQEKIHAPPPRKILDECHQVLDCEKSIYVGYISILGGCAFEYICIGKYAPFIKRNEEYFDETPDKLTFLFYNIYLSVERKKDKYYVGIISPKYEIYKELEPETIATFQPMTNHPTFAINKIYNFIHLLYNR